MEALRDWTMTIAGVIVFGSMCDMLMPENGIKKYIRLALGLILVISIITPVVSLLGGFRDGSIPQIDSEQENAYTSYSQMEERQREDITKIYRENVESKINATLETEYPGRAFETRVETSDSQENFGEILRVDVVVYTNSETGEEQRKDLSSSVEETINQNYGVDKKNIYVSAEDR